jgi:predicted dehydrogenase
MNSILFLGYSRLVQRKLITAARSAGFEQIEVSSKRNIEEIPNIDLIHKGYEKALERTNCNLVYVSLVNSDHGRWVRKVLESGKHCIVDKPSFINELEATELVSLAKAQKLLLAEASVWSNHPQSQKLLSIFEPSENKRVLAIFSMPPFEKENFRWNKNLGGGSLYDLGPYFASSGRFVFGGSATQVSAKVLAFKNNVPLSFSVQAIWPCGGNLIGYFGFDTEYVNRLEIISEKSHATLNRAFTTPPDFENPIQLNKKNKTYSIECPPADSFVCFLEEVKSSIKINHINIWHQKILDDAKTLALLFSATNQEQLVSQL